MSLKLIVEGGGDRKSKSLNRECRQAFASFLEKAGLTSKLPSIEAANGREQAYDASRQPRKVFPVSPCHWSTQTPRSQPLVMSPSTMEAEVL